MGETLIIRNSAGFHLQSNVSVQQGCDHVFCQCTIFMLFLKKLFQKLLLEMLLIFINVDVIYMFRRQETPIRHCNYCVWDTFLPVSNMYSVSKESISCFLKCIGKNVKQPRFFFLNTTFANVRGLTPFMVKSKTSK